MLLEMSYTDSISHSLSQYTRICELATQDNEVFKKFKSTPEYTAVLEHCTYDHGKGYLQVLLKENPQLVEGKFLTKFLENDIYSSPITYYYEEIKVKISPTTLRYIKVLSDLIRLFGYEKLNNSTIVEIGVGYGGLCKIIQDGINLMGGSITCYYTIDLVPVSGLVNKYLSHFPDIYKQTRIITTKDMENGWDLPSPKSLVISNYAFSECSSIVRDNYINEIINKCSYGYLTINFLNSGENEELLKKISGVSGRRIMKYPEVPLTGSGNYVLTFGVE